jgi:Zn-dependent alcohol dehydrogenase
MVPPLMGVWAAGVVDGTGTVTDEEAVGEEEVAGLVGVGVEEVQALKRKEAIRISTRETNHFFI